MSLFDWLAARRGSAKGAGDKRIMAPSRTWTMSLLLGQLCSQAESMAAWHTARSLNMGSWMAMRGYWSPHTVCDAQRLRVSVKGTGDAHQRADDRQRNLMPQCVSMRTGTPGYSMY